VCACDRARSSRSCARRARHGAVRNRDILIGRQTKSKVLQPEAVCSHARVWRVTYVFGMGARHVRFRHGRSPRPFVFSEVCCVVRKSSPCPGPRSRADPRVAASGAAAAAVLVPGHARTHVQRLRERIWAVARQLPMRLLAEPAEAVLHSEGTS
jgi:hypothetical protein